MVMFAFFSMSAVVIGTNVHCCDWHIHAHNQFHDHGFSPRAPISEYFKVPGTPCYNF